ncbi:MAG: hypothetical protein SF053_07415 [Bacteroidia bacterium]|nr:hypothetical protein [Bacteroidia bacterium]
MDLNRLPFLPPHFFYYQFTPAHKRLFVVLMLVTIIAAGLFVYTYEARGFWTPKVQEVAELSSEPLSAFTATHGYRSLDVQLTVFRAWVTYVAGPLLPSAIPAIIFGVLQVLAWATLIGALTMVRSLWIYAGYLLTAFFIHFSGLAGMLLPALPFNLGEAGLMLLILGTASLFQLDILKWDLPWRVLTFVVLLGSLTGSAAGMHGWVALHQIAGSSFPFMVVFSVGFLFFTGKEPTNLLLLIATNHPEPARRLAFPWIVVALVLLGILEFFWIESFLDFGIPGDLSLGIRPGHLLFLAGVFTVFTSQNHYNQVKGVFGLASTYTFILMGWAISVLGFVFYYTSTGDQLFTYTFDRIAAFCFMGVGLAHVYYVMTNFLPLLRQRINLYYLLGNGPKFGFVMVWLMGLVLTLLGETRDGWKSLPLTMHTYLVQAGDEALIRQDAAGAAGLYSQALDFAPASAKAHYNLASIRLAQPDQAEDALRHYLAATQYTELSYARINAAALLSSIGRTDEARAIMQAHINKGGTDAYVSHNLALTYVQGSSPKPDSAIFWLKKALLAQPDLYGGYSNLGLIYADNKLTDTAARFFEIVQREAPPSGAALANAVYFHLKTGSLSPDKFPELAEGQDKTLQYNLMALRLPASDPMHIRALRELADRDQLPDAYLLDVLRLFRSDSITYAISRASFAAETFPSVAPSVHFLMGALYFERGVPEMAAQYFHKSGVAGNPAGYFQEALMDLDRRRMDTAFVRLTALRVRHRELWDACGKELAMLYMAYGQPVAAATESDLSKLTQQEQLRMGIYADSMRQYIYALEIYRQMLAQDSGTYLPYLAMGRIYNQYQDSLAGENLRIGLKIAPEDPELRLAYARYLLGQHQWQSVGTYIPDAPVTAEALRLRAELALATADTQQALVWLDSLVRHEPLDTRGILMLCQLAERRQAWDLGNAVITQALQLNTANASLWYYYAVFSRAWSMSQDAGFGAIKAIELTDDPVRRQEIATMFAEEIRQAVP